PLSPGRRDARRSRILVPCVGPSLMGAGRRGYCGRSAGGVRGRSRVERREEVGGQRGGLPPGSRGGAGGAGRRPGGRALPASGGLLFPFFSDTGLRPPPVRGGRPA